LPQEDFIVHAGSVCFGASDETGDPTSPLATAGFIRMEVWSDAYWYDVHPDESPCTERMADDCPLSPEERDPRGLGFHRLSGNNTNSLAPPEPEEPVDFVAWGETVCGFVAYRPDLEGQWFYVRGRGLLPLALGSQQVLVMERAFEVAPETDGYGLQYRPTISNHEEMVNEFVPLGSAVVGFPCCGGEFVWVRDRGYLPLRIKGRVMLFPLFDPPSYSRTLQGGMLTWMLFDDQERHWGAVRDRFNTSTFGEMRRASSLVSYLPAPPFFTGQMYPHLTGITEKFARQWHIVLCGASLLQSGPRSRYRVSLKKHLSAFGPSSFSPEKCPGMSPLVWLQRTAQQGSTSFFGD